MNRTHGLSRTAIDNSWQQILQRCYKPSNKSFPNYGGRGIGVCEFIRASPANLLALVGQKPSPDLSIGRINNDAGYTCGKCAECLTNGWVVNVRWETGSQQARNKRTTVFATNGTETLRLIEWAERLGVNYQTLFSRKMRGQDLFAPLQK